jgi:hypothetical protein
MRRADGQISLLMRKEVMKVEIRMPKRLLVVTNKDTLSDGMNTWPELKPGE